MNREGLTYLTVTSLLILLAGILVTIIVPAMAAPSATQASRPPYTEQELQGKLIYLHPSENFICGIDSVSELHQGNALLGEINDGSRKFALFADSKSAFLPGIRCRFYSGIGYLGDLLASGD